MAHHIHTQNQPPQSIDSLNLDFFFRNNGDETFTDVSYLLGEEDRFGFAFIGAWTDFDNDGDLDIFLVNDCPYGGTSRPNKLFRNDGGTDPLQWSFTEVSADVGADDCRHGMGIAVGDYNRNGWLDYFYTNWRRPMLLQNKTGQFEDVTDEAGVGFAQQVGYTAEVSWGTNFFDYDLDGWLDLYVVAGFVGVIAAPLEQANFLFHGDGQHFTDVSAISGLNSVKASRTSIFGDYDGDGDPDMYLVNYGQETYLFRNDNDNGNHYLIVDLEGRASNRDGIGAKLKLTTPDGAVQYYETRSGSSLGGGDDLAAYFGLGPNTRVSELEITWPAGTVQTLADLTGDQRVKVIEGEGLATGIAEAPEARPSTFVSVRNYPNPFRDETVIEIMLSEPAPLDVRVYDGLGRQVKVLYQGKAFAGLHRTLWDGMDQAGQPVAAGVYLVRLVVGERSYVRKMVLTP